MQVVFRTDASLDIGTGHVMRCMTLADALRERGASSCFVCRPHPGNLIELISERGYRVMELPITQGDRVYHATTRDQESAYRSWLGVHWEADAEQTLSLLQNESVDWLIVDHYALDARWERSLRPSCRHLLVVDDLADRQHDCDLLLDQNLGRQAADYLGLVPEGCSVLAGPQYALLRPEFSTLRPYSLARRKPPALLHLLISMGGVDKDNFTARILDALAASPLPADCRITIVMGLHAPWIKQVRRKAAVLPWSTEVLVNVPDMARLMSDSDLAIGAAGTTAWERCCLGLPTLTAVLSENQRPGALALQQAGATLLIGNDLDLASELKERNSMLRRPGCLEKIIDASSAVTDGAGISHLVHALTHGPH